MLSGEVDAKDVATRAVIPSSQLEYWTPFVRVGETIATPRKRFGSHTHERQEVLIYFTEGSAQHSLSPKGAEELRAGSVIFLSAGAPATHAVNPLAGRTVRWFSVVAELPAGSSVVEEARTLSAAPTSAQPDGTTLSFLLGGDSPIRSRIGLEVVAILFPEPATTFRRVGPNRRALFYALAGRGTIDNVPLEAGEAAFVENSAAVSVAGTGGFRVVQASAPHPG